MRHLLQILALTLAAAAPGGAQSSGPTPVDVSKLGAQVGERVPDFSAVDQLGRQQTLKSLMGPKGLMLVFNRSAGWCPYCRTQLVELQGRYEELREQGLGLASFTYDPPATIKAFAEKHGITFPILSDEGGAVVTRYGILNRAFEPGHKNYGIPHPGTFILDPEGRVVSRFFEEGYEVRNTAASIAARMGNPIPAGATTPTRLATPHLELTTYATDEEVAPGHRFSLVLEVTPKPGMHVYAPGDHSYRAIAVRLDANPLIRTWSMRYPEAQEFYFEPLDERVPIYEWPFRLTQDVALLVTEESRALAKTPGAALNLTGVLEYQACTDRICYPPEERPVRWTVSVKPLQ